MRRREFLQGAAAMVSATAIGKAAAVAATEPKPNLVLFIGDDHSTFDTGCYGNDVVRTPNLDQLARDGMRFDRAFTATAMCAPSRSMLYTGLYPHRNGCHMNHGSTRADVQSLPHYLEPLGYRVVLAGKKHIKPRSTYPFEYVGLGQVGDVIRGREPFCLIIASNDPHGPHEHGAYDPAEVPLPPYLVDTPATRAGREGYYTDIDAMDGELGRALQQLEDAGKSDRTMFVYAGDHGAGFMAKWTCYEIGLRVPFIVRWPGTVTAGAATGAMVSFVDLLPTFIDAAGGTPPPTIDGRSFMPVLAGDSVRHRDTICGAHTNKGIISGQPYPVRSIRGERYKYIRNLTPDARPTNVCTHGRNATESTKGMWAEWRETAKTDEGAARLVARAMTRPAEEFYDLQRDPWELTNLVSDPAMTATKAELSQKLDDWMKQQGDRGEAAEHAVRYHSSISNQKAEH